MSYLSIASLFLIATDTPRPEVFVYSKLRVEILGLRERYIEEGSSLTLTCLVTSARKPSTLVYWYHDTSLIDYNSPRGGVDLKIDRRKGQTTARLVVSAVGPGDSGMYSCVPQGSHPATVLVHVQRDSNSQDRRPESRSSQYNRISHAQVETQILEACGQSGEAKRSEADKKSQNDIKTQRREEKEGEGVFFKPISEMMVGKARVNGR
ncbi:hypothetical protein O3P69_014629 [Scylla paramamosain]|uniref:Ig-like domain-containing protein n=1 Tax=Scylla paramamosain TaxID=85552 RepID=A0AAW0TYY8_SCYPA